MHYLAFGLLAAGGLLIAFWVAPPRPQPGKEKSAGLGEVLEQGRKALERQAEQIPLIGSSLAKTRKQRLHLAVRDRLPSFWGDLGIYLREGRRELGKAIEATIVAGTISKSGLTSWPTAQAASTGMNIWTVATLDTSSVRSVTPRHARTMVTMRGRSPTLANS